MARRRAGRTLSEARKSLESDDDEAALLTLLAVWREARVPRIADLIDRVGARVDAKRGPIKGKTVKERTEAWLAVAGKKDPADLGRLLATPWPGTWQPALPVLEALLLFPDDPRMAMAFAKIVDETRYDTWTSSNFYRPLFSRLDELLDLRTLPLLEAQLGRDKSYYYKVAMRSLEERAVTKLKAAYAEGAPTLPKEDEATLVALEALFSSDVRKEASKSKGEAEFLAEIYANPDDDALRQVFADWLSERGDPRGELIVLQLARHAGQSTDVMRKREATLINKHGEAWAGPLNRFLSKKRARVFERGFLAEGTIELEGRVETAPAGLSDPAWATLRAVHLRGPDALATEIAQLPSMRFVRALRSVPEATAWALAEGPPRPRIEELEIDTAYEPDLERRSALLSGKAFPSLRTLGIESQQLEDLDSFLQAPLARNIERVVLRNYAYPMGPLLEAIERHGLTQVKEAVLLERSHIDEWHFTFTRDARGKLSRLHVGFGSKLPSPYDLERALETLPEDALTELLVDKPHTMTWDRAYITMAEGLIARFKGLDRVEVPWERLSTARAEGHAFDLSLYGAGLGTPKQLPALWKRLHEPPFSIAFDGYEVNYSKHTSFKKDSLAEVLDALGKKRTSSIRAYRKNAVELASMQFWTGGKSLELSVPECDVDVYLGLLEHILDSASVERGGVSFRVLDEDGDETSADLDLDPPFTYQEPHLGFITVFGAKTAEFHPFDELARIFETFGWRTIRTKENLVVVAGAPDAPPDEATRLRLQLALCELLWKTHRARRGYVLPELVRQILGTALEKRGYVEVPLDEPKRSYGEVFYRNAHETGARGIYVEPRFPTGEAEIDVDLRHTRGARGADLLEDCERSSSVGIKGLTINDQFPGATAEQARASLEEIVSRLDGPIAKWFEELPKAPKKNRR